MRWLARKEIVRKTLGIGALNGLSKVFGFVREMALARFLGVGAVADAFFTSWRVPSLLRRFLAEGALNAAAVPYLVQTGKEHGKRAVSQFVTALLIVLQTLVLLIICGIWLNPHVLLWGLVPGWSGNEDRFVYAVTAVRWCMFVIVPFSVSALLAGALQVSHHFCVPAVSQLVSNVLLVGHLAVGIYGNLGMTWLLAGLVGYSCVVGVMHYGVYVWHGFSLAWPDRDIWRRVMRVMRALGACLINYGAFELNMLVDHILVSFLPVGSPSLLYYTSAFIQMPLSVFVSAFSTILLPHFTAVHDRPKRQQFYLLEALKVAIWLLIPATIVMIVFSRLIFATTILSYGVSSEFVTQASWLLRIGAVGLIPFAVNRISMNLFYSLHMPGYAGMITVAGTCVNIILSAISMQWIGLFGVVASTVIAATCKSIAYLYALYVYAGVPLPIDHMRTFIWRYLAHVALTGWGVYAVYHLMRIMIPDSLSWLLVDGFGVWLWVGPLCLGWLYVLYVTRKRFMVRVYFLRNISAVYHRDT